MSWYIEVTLTSCATKNNGNWEFVWKFYGKWMVKVHAEAKNITNVCTHFPLFLRYEIKRIEDCVLDTFFHFPLSAFFGRFFLQFVHVICLYRFGLHWNYDGLYAFCHLFAVTLYYQCQHSKWWTVTNQDGQKSERVNERDRKSSRVWKSFQHFLFGIFFQIYVWLDSVCVCVFGSELDFNWIPRRLVLKVF